MLEKGKRKMKKLVVMFLAVAAAIAANAASFNWKLQTGADYAGMNVYSLSGTTAAAVLAACESTDPAAWNGVFGDASSFKVTGNNTRAGATGEINGINDGDSMVWVIVDGSVAEGSKFWVVKDYTIPAGATYDPPTAGTQFTTKLADQGILGQGTFTAVPEPTSAMLMLVGLAGLALRRRRA